MFASHSHYLLELDVTGKTPPAFGAIAIPPTPIAIKRLPPPLRRVMGDLSDEEKALVGLHVWPSDPTAGQV